MLNGTGDGFVGAAVVEQDEEQQWDFRWHRWETS